MPDKITIDPTQRHPRPLHWRWRKLKAALRGEFPLRALGDTPASAPYGFKIPPIVYQTWVDDRFGATHRDEILSFRKLNPELSFRLMTNVAMDAYMQEHWSDHAIYEIYANARYGPLATDIFRYCIIHQRGGFYVDINKGVRRPICSFLAPQAEGLISYEGSDSYFFPESVNFDRQTFPEKIVAQWAFGFVPRHPIVAGVIDYICRYYPVIKGRKFAKPKQAIVMFTGPGMFTKAVWDYFEACSTPGVIEAGVDFFGFANMNLKGSYVRYFTLPSYSIAENAAIVD